MHLMRLASLLGLLDLSITASRRTLVFEEVVLDEEMHEQNQQRHDIVKVSLGDIGRVLIASGVHQVSSLQVHDYELHHLRNRQE